MIIQEINLYQDRFREKKVILSAIHIAVLLVAVALLLSYSSYWYQRQFLQAEQSNRDFHLQKEQSTRQLDAQRKKLEGLLANNPYEVEIKTLSRDIAVRKRMIDFVENNQFGSGTGFSGRLLALSRVNASNVWLTEISLAGDYMKLSGSALKAESVPEYFNNFRQQRLFNGKVFEVFELERLQEQDWKVDFLIASRARVGNE